MSNFIVRNTSPVICTSILNVVCLEQGVSKLLFLILKEICLQRDRNIFKYPGMNLFALNRLKY